jgi:hypothetical protein
VLATPGQGGTVSTLGIALMGICLSPFLWCSVVFQPGIKNSHWLTGIADCAADARHGIYRHGFSKPIRMIFKALFRPRREVSGVVITVNFAKTAF